MGIPPLLFVLGKGGVGRSTIAAALGLQAAARGARTLVVQWAVSDPISPWFDRAPLGPADGHTARVLLPGLETLRFSVDEALRELFVEHLGLQRLHRWVVSSRHVRRLTRAAPGFEELMFLGRLWWLTTRMKDERGWAYDRVVVDTPALGHGIGLFAVPRAAASIGLGGLVADETARVVAMLGDPARCGAVVVSSPEELAVEETIELWPRLEAELGRAPLLGVVNRGVASALAGMSDEAAACPWLAALVEGAPDAAARTALVGVHGSLVRRRARERLLAERLAGRTARGLATVGDALLAGVDDPLEVVRAAAAVLDGALGDA